MIEAVATVQRPVLTSAEQDRVFQCTAISECKRVEDAYRVTVVADSPMQAFDIVHDVFAGAIVLFDTVVPHAWALADLEAAQAVVRAKALGRDGFDTVA